MNTLLKRPRQAVLSPIALAVALCIAAPVQAQFANNLITNPGAEAAGSGNGSFNGDFVAGSLPGWAVTGQLTATSYNLPVGDGYPQPTDPGPANRGVNFFGGGYSGTSVGTQVVNLGFAQAAINGAGAGYQLSGWLGGNAGQDDNAVLSVTFRNAANAVLGSKTLGPVLANDRGGVTAMVLREGSGFVPAGATSAEVKLQMNRTGGSSNDGYADNLSFSLLAGNVGINAPQVASVGSFFEAQVAVNTPFAGAYASDTLLAFGFDLGYDTSKLRLAGVNVAAPFDDDSAFFTDISVAGSSFPGISDSTGATAASLSLATLRFEVLAEGEAVIEVRSDSRSNLSEGLTFANGANVDLLGRTGLVLTSAVPEPASALMWVLGAGALGLASRRARRPAQAQRLPAKPTAV